MNNSKTTVTIAASVIGLLLVGAIIFFTMQSKSPATVATTTTDQPTDATQEQVTASTTGTVTDSTGTTATNTSGYKDGTYTASASYRTPESTEPISVTLTLADGVVTDVSVATDPQASETGRYQAQFVAGYKQFVVGKNIDDITISRVSGSSLTSGGFKAALEKIKTQARV